MMDSKGGLTLSYTPWLRKIVNDVDLVYLAGYYNIRQNIADYCNHTIVFENFLLYNTIVYKYSDVQHQWEKWGA